MARQTHGKSRGGRRRAILWAVSASLLALPAVAMHFTDEVTWTASDFLALGVLLGCFAFAFDLLSRHASGPRYRLGAGIAAGSAFLLVWINLAVGIIGSEHEDANLLFGGVIAVAALGALAAAFRPAGMARAMAATALAQLAAGAIALVGRLGAGEPGWPGPIIGLTIVFTFAWLAASACFQAASASASAEAAGQ